MYGLEVPSPSMVSETRGELRFVSWNTRGIKDTANAPNKLSHLLDVLENVQANIAFIQETHVGPKSNGISRTFKGKGWKVYFTEYRPRSKGVAIRIRNDVTFEYICHDEDHSGSYIVLFCRLHGELYTLVNVYNHVKDRTVLHQLTEYLKETAEGVLVVGGDFNAVLDPSFDRISSAHHANQSSLRSILEDFTSSLNLRDIWAQLHPLDTDFTRCEKGSNSRLDMFFCKCEIHKNSKQNQISDHDPVVLTLWRIQQQPDNTDVASMLQEFGYNGKPHWTPENISGAEILSAIKSLIDSGEERPDTLSVDHYKRFCCPMTEILKINYNLMLKNKSIPSLFKQSNRIQNKHIFNVDYVIFSLILARRLKVFITPSFRSWKKPNFDLCFSVGFAVDPKKIKLSFLERSLTSLKPIHPAPPHDFRILKNLLPDIILPSGEFRLLQNGCSLTKPILTLVLNQLRNQILRFHSMTRVCPFRQALFIRTEKEREEEIIALLKKFQEDSGIKLKTSLKDHIYV